MQLEGTNNAISLKKMKKAIVNFALVKNLFGFEFHSNDKALWLELE